MRASDLTVVIPSRGRPEILRRTLDGLAAQTVAGFSTVVVLDGPGQARPIAPGLDRLRFVDQDHAGPGAARNRGVAVSEGRLVLFLGDDMIPEPGLVAAHLARHDAEPSDDVAVLGHVDWHPSVAGGPIERWLSASATQFDYAQLRREWDAGARDAGYGRFYSCNVSVKRALFSSVGGFDPAFVFDYEDLDLGWRLAQAGMVLRYESGAVAEHLHPQTLEGVRLRYAAHARGEWTMAAKHPWFKPWFRARVNAYLRNPRTSRVWPWLLARGVPAAESRADSWYTQAVAEEFIGAWEGERGLDELRRYLGPAFDLRSLQQSVGLVDDEAARFGDETAFYRGSQAYLYDLTAFAMSGTKEPYRRELRTLVAPGARLLDYGCGIGSDGLLFLDGGYRVSFADFANPSTAFLRWRLALRGLASEVYDIDSRPLPVPGGFDLAYAFDVIEHVEDPFAFLAELESRAGIVMVNLLEPAPDEPAIHRPLPIRALVTHAARRGLLRYRRFHDGRSHLIAYRGTGGRSAPGGRSALGGLGGAGSGAVRELRGLLARGAVILQDARRRART